tara:strand:+ start:2528 stop:4186 length:1659 start_codon:yes stop_codon:yes gene_type:complete
MEIKANLVLNEKDEEVVEFDCDYNNKDIVKSVGAKWNNVNKTWYLPYVSYSSLSQLMKINESGDVVFLMEGDLFHRYMDMDYQMQTATRLKRCGYSDLPNFKDNDNLYSHQKQTLMFGSTLEGYADLSDCGTGKTIATLSVINSRVCEKGDFKALILCPKSIILSGWIEDCRKAFPNLSSVPVIGSAKNKLKAFNSPANIYVTNYETMNQSFEFEHGDFDMLVCDEAVRLKNPSANWTKKITKLSKIIPYKVIISGLITPNNLQEIYSPFNILIPNVLGPSFYQFRDKYFTPNPYSYMSREWIPKKTAYEEITERIEPYIIRHKKSDCLDLPDKIHTCREIPMDKEQRKHYDRMLKEFVVQVEDETVTALSKGAALQKLAQITSGFIYTKDEEKPFLSFANAKSKELKNIVDGELIGEQILIFCTYRGEIEMFRDMYPNEAFITGGQNTSEQEDAIQKFKSGECRVLFANIKASKYGLTFTNCNYVIYFSLSYSLDDMYQSEERIHRIGQEDVCNYIYLMAEKSTDKRVYNAIKKKQNLNDMMYSLIDEYKD